MEKIHGIKHRYIHKERRGKLYVCEECGFSTKDVKSYYIHGRKMHPFGNFRSNFGKMMEKMPDLEKLDRIFAEGKFEVGLFGEVKFGDSEFGGSVFREGDSFNLPTLAGKSSFEEDGNESTLPKSGMPQVFNRITSLIETNENSVVEVT